ncbi:MAG: YfhO family protein [Treponema sp.]|jgi:hypothetical protein|nr:YfhO family protein [Treponema sp.]
MKDLQIKNWQILLFLLALPMAAYIKYPLNDLSIMDAGDGAQFLSGLQFQANNILNGDFAVWNKYLSAGVPAIVIITIYYPMAILFGFLPPAWSILFYYCFHIAFGAFFFYLFLREVNCNIKTSIIVSVIWLFSIHIGGMRKSHMNIITVIPMLPVGMYFIQKFLNSNLLKWLVLSTVALGLAFLGGHPQIATYVAGTVFIYYLVSAIKKRMPFSAIVKNCGLLIFSSLGFSALTIFPTAEIVLEYMRQGSSEISFSFFSSYSIHPIKLIQMIIPRFFKESIFMAYGPMNSSEMDIELFMGVIVIIVILFSVKTYWRHFHIKLSILFCVIVFSYAAIAHIPVLREFVYHLPIIGGFRVPSRALFIFLFFMYVILSIGITRLSEEESLDRFLRFQRRTAFVFVLVCGTVILAIYVLTQLYSITEIMPIKNYIHTTFFPLIIIALEFALVMSSASILIKHFGKGNCNNKFYNTFLVLLIIITLGETLPFSLMTHASPIDGFVIRNKGNKRLKNNIGNYKIFDAFPGVDGGHMSFVSQNKGMVNKMSVINSYIPYNNPILYKLLSGDHNVQFNFSGLLTGSQNARENVLRQNDLLSMLGVKYVIDSNKLIPDDGYVTAMAEQEEAEISERMLNVDGEFTLASSVGGYTLEQHIVPVKPYRYYEVRFDFQTNAQQGVVYVDFWGENYDLNACQQGVDITSKSGHVLLNLFNDDSSVCPSDIYFRIVSVGLDDALIVDNLQISEYIGGIKEKMYVPYIIDDENRIFENVNVRDILYFADELRNIDSIDYIFRNRYGLQLDKINYVVGSEDKSYNLQGSIIKNIDFRNNAITATVESDHEGFLNFSQCYFPGWRVYIDGKRADLKVVNALIMGVEIPWGTHEVRFSFVSAGFVLGAIITSVNAIFWIAWLVIILYFKKRRNKL